MCLLPQSIQCIFVDPVVQMTVRTRQHTKEGQINSELVFHFLAVDIGIK